MLAAIPAMIGAFRTFGRKQPAVLQAVLWFLFLPLLLLEHAPRTEESLPYFLPIFFVSH